MLEKLVTAIAVPEIRKRIQFVFLMFAVYVVALHVPAAGINHDAVERLIGNGIFGVVDTFSGGALRKFSVIAMGIMPYINASIIMQLMTVAIPQLQKLSKEGESGRKEISKYTRYLSVVLGVIQAFGLYQVFSRGGAIESSFLNAITVVITLTAGTMFLLWLGEQITEHGIGNGVSLMIFVGIMVSIPGQISRTAVALSEGAVPVIGVIVVIALFLASIVGIIFMTQGVRRIPVHHMKKVVGNRMSQASATYLPLKVNTAGVIPIIFAMSIQLFPATFAQFIPATTPFGVFVHNATTWLQPGSNIWASLIFAGLVLFFSYFYTAIQYDPTEISDNLRKYGSYIPGISPGKPTAMYLDRVLTRITLAGALFLTAVALVQYWAPTITRVNTITLVGGTSLLIVVGVALETMQAIEAQMAMRNYEGFIRKSAAGDSGETPRTGGRTAVGAR